MAYHSALADFIDQHRSLFVLTGAGCSTPSGIPDYRDANGDWKRNAPVMFQDFVREHHTRQRYWARSLIGWRIISNAQPNAAHRTLADFEAQGRVELLVTQNVDGLHQAAGSQNVIDLHGRIDTIRCLNCASVLQRADMQAALERRNPHFAGLVAHSAPDGDADLDEIDFSGFDVPACENCEGVLKPNVVFFGESVPGERVQRAMAGVQAADAMLIVGSSLMVYSGYRFARAMAETGKPVAAINIGRTRADDLLSVKVSDTCTDVLPQILSRD